MKISIWQTLSAATLFVASMTLVAPFASAANIVINGNFATGTFSNWTEHTCSTGCLVQGFAVGTLPDDPGFPTDTTEAAETACVNAPCNNPTTGDWISQVLVTIPSDMYTLTFAYDPGAPGTTTEIQAYWNGVVVDTITNATANTWHTYTVTGLSAPTSSTTLEFTGRQDPATLFLTDIAVNASSVSTTPEPATFAFMGMGLLALGAIARRRFTR
jgi:MYXO-CTERM domain-containing protein